MGDIRFDKIITPENQIAYDLDWFGVDRSGQVAHFASGGCGHIPSVVISDNQARLRVLQYFTTSDPVTNSIRVMSTIGKRLAFGVDGFFSSYDNMSRRGLFSFSAQDNGFFPIVYVVATKPAMPLHVSSLPDQIASLISENVITANFSSITAINFT